MKGTVRAMYNPQLDTFLCVVESGSFNKAAEKLYISPPAVIKQINLLEEGLDLQLFVRTHRGLQLTDAGKSLYQDAKYIIQYCKDSVTRAKNCHAKDGECHPHRHLSHDAGSGTGRPLAEIAGGLPGDKVPAGSLRQYAGKRQRDPGQSGTEHRCGCGHLRRDDAESAPVRRIGDFQGTHLLCSIRPSPAGPEGTVDGAGSLWRKT